jgi:alpha-ketoglutarate-dependent taurine dioxygenase
MVYCEETIPHRVLAMPTTLPGAERSRAAHAWTAATAGQQGDWRCPLPADPIAALSQLVAESPPEQPIAELRLSEEAREAWRPALAPVLDELETGRGFVILDRLPVERWSSREATIAYWLLGQALGEPFAQNVQGTLLYDVRDTGQDVASGARFSVTNYESSFHTDNSFGDTVLDYVGLLCLQAAKSGGISQNVSGHAVLDVLEREHPAVLRTLSQPFHVDRRGGVLDGQSPTVLRPVVSWESGGLVLRYLRHWIEVGHEKADQPMTTEQRHALDTLDAVVARPELRVEFSLQPGQIYFTNNRWILHNRTAFADHPELERRRHLVRLWLRARSRHAPTG